MIGGKYRFDTDKYRIRNNILFVYINTMNLCIRKCFVMNQ
ncbi:MAG: hypothetical protein K0S47_2474 [Herbinix sp.]|jgi:hypothetical protein|nr:hypothetical protein [Herbinix sp.]